MINKRCFRPQNRANKLRLKPAERTASSTLKAVLAAALAIPGVTTSTLAQTAPDEAAMRLQYSYYKDRQAGGEDRVRIRSPLAWARMPFGETWEAEGSFQYDSFSGASPQYLSTLSGASGKGINDIRRAGDLKFTRYFERFALGLGGLVSSEDDYNSRGGIFEGRWWTDDKNTTLTTGFAAYADDISATNNPRVDERRRTVHFLLGGTQVLDRSSLIQSNLSYGAANGFLTDPYKFFDNRPRNRHSLAWLTRYNRFIEKTRGSLHLDYRYYRDNWSIISHLFDVAYYQPLGSIWTFRPSVRYYTQSSADFFSNIYPPTDFDIHYSADQRLGGFGGVTLGLKVYCNIGWGTTLDLSAEYLRQKPDYKLGGDHNSEGIERFVAEIFSFGITKKFS